MKHLLALTALSCLSGIHGALVKTGCYDVGYEYGPEGFGPVYSTTLQEVPMDGTASDPAMPWLACEDMCEQTDGCNYFTWEAGKCHKIKEERDKMWAPNEVYVTEAADEAECVQSCAEDPECNIGHRFEPPICKLKTSLVPVKQLKAWYTLVSGPAPCPGLNRTELVELGKTSVGTGGCALNYERSGDMCYRIAYDDRKTQPDAATECAKVENGSLAMPKTRELGLNILALFCPKVPEGVGIGPVIEKPTEVGSSTFECVVPRGDNLDGPYYMGLVSEQIGSGLNVSIGAWSWVDGEPLGEWSAWGGQGENTPLLYGDFPTIQPDNTSGKQLCTYFYPRNSPEFGGSPNGGWGDEDCLHKCLFPAQDMNRTSQSTCWTQGEGGYFDVSDVDADPSGQLGGLVTAAEWDEGINVGKITDTPRHYICEAPIGMEGVALDDCVDDPDKVSPGMCGCGVKDIDSDLDGLMDCLDSAPDDATIRSANETVAAQITNMLQNSSMAATPDDVSASVPPEETVAEPKGAVMWTVAEEDLTAADALKRLRRA